MSLARLGLPLSTARIAALSTRLADEHSQVYLQTFPMTSKVNERMQQLEKLFQSQQHGISAQNDFITAMQLWLQAHCDLRRQLWDRIPLGEVHAHLRVLLGVSRDMWLRVCLDHLRLPVGDVSHFSAVPAWGPESMGGVG